MSIAREESFVVSKPNSVVHEVGSAILDGVQGILDCIKSTHESSLQQAITDQEHGVDEILEAQQHLLNAYAVIKAHFEAKSLTQAVQSSQK